jgi:hypothetical protein
VNDLNIECEKYMDSEDIPLFIKVRNKLLHGSFISDDKEFFQAEEIAQKLGTEILLAIMKIISKADDAQSSGSSVLSVPNYQFSDALHLSWLGFQGARPSTASGLTRGS